MFTALLGSAVFGIARFEALNLLRAKKIISMSGGDCGLAINCYMQMFCKHAIYIYMQNLYMDPPYHGPKPNIYHAQIIVINGTFQLSTSRVRRLPGVRGQIGFFGWDEIHL